MIRFTFYLRLKEAYVHDEPEHVVLLAMTASVIAESEDTARQLVSLVIRPWDSYDIIDVVQAIEK